MIDTFSPQLQRFGATTVRHNYTKKGPTGICRPLLCGESEIPPARGRRYLGALPGGRGKAMFSK